MSVTDAENWNTTRVFLMKALPEPPLSFPRKMLIGLKEEITRAGYIPETMGPIIITAIKTNHILELLKLSALPVRTLKYGIERMTSARASNDAMILIINDSTKNCLTK